MNRVLWITNMAPPYRRPLWEEIGRNVPLTVAVLEGPTRRTVHRANRGNDWYLGSGENFELREMTATRMSIQGRTLHTVRHGELRRLLRAHQAVVLGGWESPVYWQASLEAGLSDITRIGFYESTMTTQRYSSGPFAALRNNFFNRLDAVVVPGEAASDAVRTMGIESRRIVQGFNAVDVNWMHVETNKLRAASHVRNEQEPHRFLYIGQLIDRKNVDSLILGFSKLPNASLTIVGDGPAAARLQRLAAQCPRSDLFHFEPPTKYDALPELYARHDTLVLPSHEEVWGLVVNEALAAGLHCVVTERSGVSASVKSMPGVWLCESSPKSIRQAMASSAAAWAGPITQPEILAYTPEAFASTFLDALHRPPRVEK